MKCKICGDIVPVTAVDKLCDGCWEVTHRLDKFIQYPEGRKEIFNRLVKRETKCKKSD